MTELLPDGAIERHIGILGKTGSGKSNTAKVIAEGIMSKGGRVCVIDPTGTWWGMRLRADGAAKSKFEPVIFGGNHADIEITGEHGAAIGEAIATASSSAIIDTRLLGTSGRTKFFTAFGDALLQSNRGVLHLIIDEAHLFAPQGRVNDPQSGAMLSVANNLVSLGRGIGLRIIMITQRPAKLHKDSLSQVETLIAMRLMAPQDRKAIDDWIGEWAEKGVGNEVIASLPSMPTGTAWVWSPEVGFLEQVKFPLAETFDSGKPTARQQAVAPIDIKDLGGKLDAIRQEAVANDPKRLRGEIARLTKELATKKDALPAAEPDQKHPVVQDWLKEAWADGRATGYGIGYVDARNALCKAFGEAAQKLADDILSNRGGEPEDIAVPVMAGKMDRKVTAPFKPHPAIAHSNPPFSKMKPETQRAVNAVAEAAIAYMGKEDGGTPITPAKRRILAALRELEAIGQTSPDKQTVAWFADASPKSSAFANNLGALRTAGLIDYPSQGAVTLTSAGCQAEPPRAAPTHDSIMAIVRGKVTPAMMRILESAIAAYPDSVYQAQIAEEAGASPTSSAFANNKGRLRSLGLIEYPTQGTVRAADMLFPG